MHHGCVKKPTSDDFGPYIRKIQILENELSKAKHELSVRTIELDHALAKDYLDKKTLQETHQEKLCTLMQLLQTEQIKVKQMQKRKTIEYRIIKEMVKTLEYELSDLHKNNEQLVAQLTEKKIQCIYLENELRKKNGM